MYLMYFYSFETKIFILFIKFKNLKIQNEKYIKIYFIYNNS